MIYQHLFSKIDTPATVRAGVIGVGQFATPIVTQSTTIPRLDVPVVADIDPEAGRRAFVAAGIAEDDVIICDGERGAREALSRGKRVVLQDGALMMDLDLDVIVTATRSPEAGAANALAAIEHGKHIVMVDKEADSVVGAVLKHKADRAGVVYTTDDGDEPGLVMGLVNWARTLGLEVLAGGNLHACRWEPDHLRATARGVAVQVGEADRWAMERIPSGETARYAAARRRVFGAWRRDEECGDPLAHLAVLANGTGLLPDRSVGHRPACRYVELPELMCPTTMGGILDSRGVVDMPTILYSDDEPYPGGGVFIVVSNDDTASREMMVQKGAIANADHSALLLFRPYHLCGAETAMSILCAGLLQTPTGAASIEPRVDIVATTTRDWRAGERLGASGTLGWNRDLKASMVAGFAINDNAALPFFMLEGQRLSRDVPAGTVITADMLAPAKDTALRRLRREQDALFGDLLVQGKRIPRCRLVRIQVYSLQH